jgi:hypothetical protein
MSSRSDRFPYSVTLPPLASWPTNDAASSSPSLPDIYRNALEIAAQYAPCPRANALAEVGLAAAREPEVAPSERRLVAWRNAPIVPGYPDEWRQCPYTQRMLNWYEHGLKTAFGWHIHHRLDQALGGRHTASNLVARYWHDNVTDGGHLSATLKSL